MLAIFNYYTELQPQPVEVGKVNIFFLPKAVRSNFKLVISEKFPFGLIHPSEGAIAVTVIDLIMHSLSMNVFILILPQQCRRWRSVQIWFLTGEIV